MTPTPPEPTTVGATRWYVFTASDDLKTYELVGVHEASGRDQAIRKQFGKNPPLCVAVSEHQWQVKKPRWKPVPDGFETVAMPDDLIAPASDATPEALDIEPAVALLADEPVEEVVGLA